MACLSSNIINFIAGTDPHWFYHFKEIGQIFCYKYIFIRKNFHGKWFGQMCFFSNVQALGTLWDFHLENHFQSFIGRESNWPTSCLNDSETQEKGTLGVKIQKISQWSMPLDPHIGLHLWRLLRKLVCLRIYPRFAYSIQHIADSIKVALIDTFGNWQLAIGHLYIRKSMQMIC